MINQSIGAVLTPKTVIGERLSDLIEQHNLSLVATEASNIQWACPQASAANLPLQGFKLHVSATVQNAVEVFKRTIPLLLELKLPFKVAGTLEMLGQLNAGKYGVRQVGKFITIYPHSRLLALHVASIVHDRTRNEVSPRIPSDYRYKSGIVYYRYGRLRYDAVDPHGQLTLPDGTTVTDGRDPRQPVPPAIFDPFYAFGCREALPKDTTFIKNGVIIYQCIRQRGKGGVYRALQCIREPNRPSYVCKIILKEARFKGDIDARGVDACERLKWQARLLEEMQGSPGIPKLHGLFSISDNLYLAMDDVGGETLEEKVLGEQPITKSAIHGWMENLFSLVHYLHAMKRLVCCDISPSNIIVGADGKIYLTDFEHSFRRDGPPFCGAGLPGFYPHSLRGIPVPTFAAPERDIYALGALIHVLLQPQWFKNWVFNQAEAAKAWDRPMVPNEAVPESYAAVINKAMAGAYNSAAEMHEEFRRLAE